MAIGKTLIDRSKPYICAQCFRYSVRPSTANFSRWHNSPTRKRFKSSTTPTDDAPIADYYADLLSQPLPSSSPQTRSFPASLPSAATSPVSDPSTTSTPQASSTTNTPQSKPSNIEKARIVFGSRLAGPAERQRFKEAGGTMIGGILVPPCPEEPDNCCMSGCVNCVWEVYRDDMEEFVQMRAEGNRRLLMQRGGGSMDDDGGGSEALWTPGVDDAPGKKEEDAFEGVPIGIREFMMVEKRLKERRKEAGLKA
ncbi:hypothetical protein MMC25_004441 [Agyrium rufum]|nr:hypothetical protein [Agyrium rufum]